MNLYAYGLLIALLTAKTVTAGTTTTPLQTRDQNPLVLIHGLPSATAAELPAAGRIQTSISLNISNTLNIDVTENTLLLIDGETYQLNLTMDFGLTDGWAIRGSLPLIAYSGGFLDQPIEQYHDTFGFSQGDRLENPRDRLLFFYQRNNTEQLRLTRRNSGLGDIQLIAGRQLHANEHSAYSLWAGLKLPTGDSETLNGSGAADLSVWLAGKKTISNRLNSYGTIGVLQLGNGDVLPELQENTVFHGNLGLVWQTWPQLAFKAQFEAHTEFYKAPGTAFLSDVLQLSIGGTWQITDRFEFDFAVAEDIKEDASPDVNFHFNLRINR